MRKFKKILAFSLASAMIVSAVPASAATANTAKAGKATIYYNGNTSYKSTWVKTTTKTGYTVKFFNKTASVATLDKKSGKVTAKKAGTAQVKVNFYKGGKYVGNKVVKIAVKKAPVGKGIKAEQTTLAVGETTKIVSSNGVKLNCYSADKKVVTVNKTTGVVTAVAPGTTKIAAVNAISGKKVYVEITVNADLAAKQSGAKQITLTGSGFTKDTKVEVKKGNTVIDVDSAKQEVTSDGKTLIVPTKNVITAGEYTVTVGDKTVKFNGEASKVTSIEISDVAVVDKGVTLPITTDAASKKATGATITYVVKDQFGADVTKTSNVQVNTSRTQYTPDKPEKGKIAVSLNAYDKKDDLISVVVIYTETGLSTTKNVKITDAAVVNEVTFAGVYNESNKELTEDTAKDNGINNFYYLFDVVDQYGKSMVSSNFTVGTAMDSDLIVNVAPGATNVTFDTAKAKVVKKDGKDYVAVQLTKAAASTEISAGKGTILVITKLGKTFNGEFEVKAGEKIDTFTASPSDVVIAGEKTVFDFTAVDTYGNDISAKAAKGMFSTASQGLFDSKNGDYFKFTKNAKTGKNELVFVAKSGEVDRPYVASFITATNKVVTVQFTIKANQKPSAIGTVDSFGIVAKAGRTKEVKAKDVKVTNQYGTNFEFNSFDTVNGDYKLGVVKVDGTGSTVKVENGKAIFTADGAVGTANYKYQLFDKDNKVVSEESFSVTTKDLKDIVASATDITVKDMPKMHYDSERKLEVTASIAGNKVTLEAGEAADYVIYSNGTPTVDVVSGGVFGVQKTSAAGTEKEGSYTIVINNGKGIEVTKKVLVCREDAYVKEVALKDDADSITEPTVTVKEVLDRLEVKDQYGKVMDTADLKATTRVTFTDAVTLDAEGKQVDAKVDNNGTTNAQVILGKGGSAIAELTFKNGVKFTTPVVVE